MAPCITIIGLGPGDNEHWTQAAATQLGQADEIYLRTSHHPSISSLQGKLHSFEDLFGASDDIDEAHQQIAAEIVRLGIRERGVIYAVPGHPLVDEPTVPLICTLAGAKRIPVTIIPGLSLVEAARIALGLDADQTLQIVNGPELAQLHHPLLSPDQTAVITHFTPNLAVAVQKTLLNAYPENFTITLIHAPGSQHERLTTCQLSDLSKQTFQNELTLLYLPADITNTGFVTFQDIIAHLRGPDGCPWDREQTHQSLRPYLLEETYEVLEALDANDTAALAEELGDLLLQIVLHTQIAIDNGEFKMGEVIGHISQKMLRRHPHVFGDVAVSGADEVVTNWQAIKKAEKAAKGAANPTHSVLDGVPPALPALAQTWAICQRVVRIGFEWPNIEGVLDKLTEEAQEITEATDPSHLEAEIGDFLFNAVNLARWYDVDPESALRAANARFARRFKRVEAMAAKQGRALVEMTLEEMQALWQEVKRLEG